MVSKRAKSIIRDGSGFWTAVIYASATLICIVTIYPYYYVLIQSFADPIEVVAGTNWFWPKNYYFGSYEIIIKNAQMWKAFANSVFYVIVGTVLTLITSVMGAYPLSVQKIWGRKFLVRYLIIPMYFGGGLIPTFILMTTLRLYNNIWAMILPGIVGIWFIILARTYFMTIPSSMSESAKVDGAGHFRILFSIVVPLSKPVLAVIAIYTVVGIWNSWFNALIYLPNKNLHPLQFYLYRLMIQQSADLTKLQGMAAFEEAIQMILANYQLKFALIIFTTLPVIFTYPFFQKYFIKGIMLGSLKG